MNNTIQIAASLFVYLTICQPFLPAEDSGNQSQIILAREARDRASVEDLKKVIAMVKKEANESNDFQAYLRLALFHSWLCEAYDVHKDDTLIKQAATDGLVAAEKAAVLNRESSQAHQLVGELLNELIPHVFGGGMRYGKRAAAEMDKAIQLNPNNPDAHISRAISYYYTPEAFGGGRDKAFQLLHRAIDLDPQADTAHIWLAIFFLNTHQLQEASREIQAARQINARRAFTNSVSDQVDAAIKQ